MGKKTKAKQSFKFWTSAKYETDKLRWRSKGQLILKPEIRWRFEGRLILNYYLDIKSKAKPLPLLFPRRANFYVYYTIVKCAAPPLSPVVLQRYILAISYFWCARDSYRSLFVFGTPPVCMPPKQRAQESSVLEHASVFACSKLSRCGTFWYSVSSAAQIVQPIPFTIYSILTMSFSYYRFLILQRPWNRFLHMYQLLRTTCTRPPQHRHGHDGKLVA